MSLKKKIKELETEIKNEGGETDEKEAQDEAGDVDEPDDAADDGGKDVQDPDQKQPDEGKGNQDKGADVQDKSDLTAQERARLRILEKENRELKAQREAPPKQKEENKKDEDPEPNKAEDPVAWLEWDNRQVKKQLAEERGYRETKEKRERAAAEYDEAKAELSQFEVAVRNRIPDYEKVSSHVLRGMAAEIMDANPDLPRHKLGVAVEREVIRKASLFLNAGLDPAQALYDLGRSKYGYKEEPEQKGEEKPSKPDLEKINQAKKKSASPANGGRNSKAGVSIDDFSKMSTAQKAKLSKAEIDELLANAD